MTDGRPPLATHRRRARFTVLLLALSLAAAACSGSHDGRSARGGAAGQRSQGPAEESPGASGDLYTGPPASGAPKPLGMKWDWQRVNSFAPYLQTLSGGSTFYEVVWCDVQPQPDGARDWSTPDRVATAGRKLGYSVFLHIRVGSCWATGGRGAERGRKNRTASAMPLDLDAYQAFVRATVERYSALGVHEYSVENEANGAGFWAGTAEQYDKLVRLAAGVIRSADPRAKVLDCGISSTAYGVGIADRLLQQGREADAVAAYQSYYGRRFPVRGRELPQVADVGELRAALAGDQSRRNLDFLAVDQRLAADRVIDAHQLHFYESWVNAPALLGYLHDVLPAGFPIEAWEVGEFWPDAPDDKQVQAAEVTKMTALLLGGGVRPVIWLPLSFSPGGRHDSEIRFGLLDPDGSTRPSGDAFARLAAAAEGASVRPVSAGAVAGVAFSRGDQSTLVLWSETGGTLPAPPMPGAAATDTRGAAVAWGQAGLQLGPQPVVVSGPAGLAASLRLPG